jgi:hypothetical protein
MKSKIHEYQIKYLKMGKQKITFLIALLFLIHTSNIDAQSNNTFFLGHSLINFDVPNIVDKLSIAGSQTFSYDANIGNGANLSWHWNNPTTGQGPQWDLTLPNGGYENFIITEAIPLDGHLMYSDTYTIADNFYNFAEQYNPNIQYYIYETWHCASSGTSNADAACGGDPNNTILWRDRLDIDLPKWESIADHVNLTHTNPMLVIPGGQAFARLADRIENGEVPGLTSVFDLFVDEHHLDSRGNYFIACVMYAVMHGESPVGLPNQLTTQYGTLYTEYPTPAQAAIMQETAWQTICDYQRDGVACAALSISSVEDERSSIKIYPVPTTNQLSIQFVDSFSENVSFSIHDQLGKIVLQDVLNSDMTSVNLTALSAGIYFLKIKNEVFKFIKS